MIQAQVVIEAGKTFSVAVNLLEREDANKHEREFANTIQKIVIELMSELAKATGTELQSEYIEPTGDVA